MLHTEFSPVKKVFLLTCKYMSKNKEKNNIFYMFFGFKLSMLEWGDICQIKILKNGGKIRYEFCKSLGFLWIQASVIESTTPNARICKGGGSSMVHFFCLIKYERFELTSPGLTDYIGIYLCMNTLFPCRFHFKMPGIIPNKFGHLIAMSNLEV